MNRRAGTPRIARRILATLLVAAGFVVAAGYTPGGSTTAFADRTTQTAGTDHRAVVTVDTGSLVKTVCIHFTADSISGTQALDLAGVDPVYRGYGTTGAAVCSLCNQGCPPDSSCLTCGGANYWQYYRSPAGTASYTYSPAGAGATQVHDGDVEAWKWGNRQMPVHVTVDSVCGPSAQVIPTTLQPQTTTAAPVQTTSATSGGSGSGSSVSTGGTGGTGGAGAKGSGTGSATATTAAKAGAAGATTGGSSTTTSPGTPTTAAGSVAGAAAAHGSGPSTTAGGVSKRALSDPVAPKLSGGKGGGSPLPLVLVGVLVLALAGAGVFLRLRRGRPAAS